MGGASREAAWLDARPMRAAVVIAALAIACTARREPEVAVAPAVVGTPPAPVPAALEEAEPEPEPVTFGKWAGFGPAGCAYLAPTDGRGLRADGGVDVLFHFHAGQMSDRDLRASGLRAVIVSCGWGMGTTPYARAFADPSRFDRMLRSLTKKIGATHVRKLALASWSAGFASVGRILRVPRYYARVDAVVLLDSLHSRYEADGSVDTRMLEPFVRFARDAARGDKVMVMTHSAIVPPGYASSTEATRAVLDAIDVPTVTLPADAPREGTMRPLLRVDAGNLHVRGFRGAGPQDHFDHLHLVGQVLRSWLVPRWGRDRYTPAGEQR